MVDYISVVGKIKFKTVVSYTSNYNFSQNHFQYKEWSYLFNKFKVKQTCFKNTLALTSETYYLLYITFEICAYL